MSYFFAYSGSTRCVITTAHSASEDERPIPATIFFLLRFLLSARDLVYQGESLKKTLSRPGRNAPGIGGPKTKEDPNETHQLFRTNELHGRGPDGARERAPCAAPGTVLFKEAGI